MFKIILTSALLQLALCNQVCHGEDSADRAKRIAVTCGACHGQNGITNVPLWPNLAGQNPTYSIKQLHDFKYGSRKDPMMEPVAAGLSDDDISALARHFSNLKSGG